MGRLPRKITTQITPKLTLKAWVWIGGGLVIFAVYSFYNMYQLKPITLFKKPKPIVTQADDLIPQMEEPTTQDLQALPIAQETAEEVIVMDDLKGDELVQIFEIQEKNTANNTSKPNAPVVMKRSLGLV